jgi:hypothetical protein
MTSEAEYAAAVQMLRELVKQLGLAEVLAALGDAIDDGTANHVVEELEGLSLRVALRSPDEGDKL